MDHLRVLLVIGIMLVAFFSRAYFAQPEYFGLNPDSVGFFLLAEPAERAREQEVPLLSWLLPFFRSAYPPLYAWAIETANYVVHDSWLAGRFVSVVSGSMLCGTVYAIASCVFGTGVGLISAALTSVSPIVLYYDTKARPEALATLFLYLAILSLLRYHKGRQQTWAVLSLVFSGISSLTKYEAFFLAPLLLVLLYRDRPRTSLTRYALGLLGGSVFWMPTLWWIWTHGFGGRIVAFTGAFTFTPCFFWKRFLWMLWTLKAFVPMLSWPVALAGLVGLVSRKARSGAPRMLWWISGCLCVVWIVVHAFHHDWLTRYFYQVLPLGCIYGAVGIMYCVSKLEQAYSRLPSWLLIASVCVPVVGVSFFEAVDAVRGEKALFAEVKDAAVWVKAHADSDVLIFSDEQALTYYYLKRDIQKYDRASVRAGTYVILHDFFLWFFNGTTLEQELRWLSERFTCTEAYRCTVRFKPSAGNALSQAVLRDIGRDFPALMAYRDQWLSNLAVVLWLDPRETDAKETSPLGHIQGP